MRKLIPVLVVLFLLGVWTWIQSAGTWIVGPISTDYDSGVTPTGDVVYNDINEFKAAFNGGIGDTNIMEIAGIDLDKLEQGVMYHAEGYASPKEMVYGDLNMHWSNVQAKYGLTDTLLYDSTYIFLIDFGDSSDVGDPVFGAEPHITLGPLSIAGSGLSAPKTNIYAGMQAAVAGSLDYCVQFAAAGSCSVYVHYTGADTIFGGVQLYWEAKQK